MQHLLIKNKVTCKIFCNSVDILYSVPINFIEVINLKKILHYFRIKEDVHYHECAGSLENLRFRLILTSLDLFKHENVLYISNFWLIIREYLAITWD